MRGGYRQGAGRKQGFAAKNAEEAHQILSEMVMSEIKPIGKLKTTNELNHAKQKSSKFSLVLT